MLKARVYSPLCRLWRRGISSIIHLSSFFFLLQSPSPKREALRNWESLTEVFGNESPQRNWCSDGASARRLRKPAHGGSELSVKGHLLLSCRGILATFISRTLRRRVLISPALKVLSNDPEARVDVIFMLMRLLELTECVDRRYMCVCSSLQYS